MFISWFVNISSTSEFPVLVIVNQSDTSNNLKTLFESYRILFRLLNNYLRNIMELIN